MKYNKDITHVLPNGIKVCKADMPRYNADMEIWLQSSDILQKEELNGNYIASDGDASVMVTGEITKD